MKISESVRPGVIFLLIFFLGMVVAMVELTLYNSGILVDEFISQSASIVITDLMIVTMLLFSLVGIIVAVVKG